MRTIAELRQHMPQVSEKGLSAADVAESARLFGTNQLKPLPRESLWLRFLAKFDEPIIKILLLAALLSMLVDLFRTDRLLAGLGLAAMVAALTGAALTRRSQWVPSILFISGIGLFFVGLVEQHVLVEGLAVMVAVILATGVAFASEYKSDREFEILNAEKDSQRATVLRGGEFMTIPVEQVVGGDVVALETGDEVCADGRLIASTGLYVDQSLMTGESEPVRKQAAPEGDDADGLDHAASVFRGTQVVDGIGQMLVTDVGDTTLLGQIALQLSAPDEQEDDEDRNTPSPSNQGERVHRKLTISKRPTPLQQKLEHLARTISKAGYIAAVFIFLAQLVHGTITGAVFWTTDPDELVGISGVLLAYFVNMVIIIVVAVPEGLPMSVTVSLALAMRRMTRANSLVRQLAACETIGSATVICTDKTGTLTQNKMQVVQVCWDSQTLERGSPQWSPRRQSCQVCLTTHSPPLDWIAFNAAINSTAKLQAKDGQLVPIGNTTEGALLQWLLELGIDLPRLRQDFTPHFQVHFSSERKRMTTVVRDGDRFIVLAKGSPEWLLANSVQYLAANGTVRPWTPLARQAAQEQLTAAAARALRTLAFGYASVPGDMPADPESLHARQSTLETDLVYIGFVAIRDPLRPEVMDAISKCRRASINVKMITGDNVETARAIAYEIGLLDGPQIPVNAADGIVMTSDHFNSLTDEQLKQILPNLRVLARARPLDKLRMVKLLQALGEVVAVTGDGTNDAPALKKADVGLSMGIAGSAVAKEASKIVLLDDSFATIVKAVHWGRALYENIQRFLQFQLTINVAALATCLLATLVFGIDAPFTVLQLLWINVIMDTLASIALCSEPPRPGLMKLPPKKRDENIITPAIRRTIITTAAFFVLAMLALLTAMHGTPFSSAWFTDQPGLLFSVFVFFQVWNQINCRSLTPDVSGLRGILRNPTFLAIAATVAIGQIIIVTFGGAVFRVEPLSPLTWLCIAAGTSSVLIFSELVRFIERKLKHSGIARGGIR